VLYELQKNHLSTPFFTTASNFDLAIARRYREIEKKYIRVDCDKKF
jgi:hypothetical protein